MVAETKPLEHSPGPWHTEWVGVVLRVFDAEGNSFAPDPGSTPELARANAELIAAAPDLLAACEAAIEAIKNEWLYQTGQFARRATPPSNYPEQGSVHGGLADVQLALRAAITEARGLTS